MAEIAWHLLQPVDTGAQVQQGFATGMAITKEIQKRNALAAYMQAPDDPQALNALAFIDPNTAAAMQEREAARLKEQRDIEDRQRAVALGELYNADPQGARREAIGAGDFELAKTFGDMDEATQKRTAAIWDKAGAAAFQLKQTPPEQRPQLWAQIRPILEAEGAPAQILDNFDPTNDAQLDAAIGQAQSIKDLVEQSRVTWHQQGEQPSFATDFMGRPVGNANPYAQGASAAPAAAAGGGFDAAIAHVLGNEGGYAPSDMNGAPVNFGINQGANPDIDVKSLTPDTAKQVYYERYWKPSGAESLPPNMQAPYFDVYIRNPSFAKRALAESGGYPARFMDLADGYFGTLAQKPEGRKYAEAWRNRDAKNRAIATGGATGMPRPGAVEDGYRFLGGDPANPASWQKVQ